MMEKEVMNSEPNKPRLFFLGNINVFLSILILNGGKVISTEI